jgi:hypothetical protein
MMDIKNLTQWLRGFVRQSEHINVRGEVHLRVFEGEELVQDFSDKNLVVTLGRTNIAKLLGGDAAGKKITSFKAGTSGTAPTSADTAITSPFSKAITSATYPAAGQVQFNFSIETSEANGMTIQEFGLFNEDGSMFARKTWGAIAKTNSIRIVGTWKIIF